MLAFANEMLHYILRVRDSRKRVLTTEERHFMEKVYPAVCKLVTYMGGYLHQDQSAADGTSELKAGLGHIVNAFCGITLKPSSAKGEKYDYESYPVLDLTDDESYLIYSLFDGLNYLFGLADFKAIETIVNADLFHGLASLCHLDTKERLIFERAETSNEFYHLQSGSNRKHYKEFAYAFIGDVIKHPEASLKFLLFCSKMYTEHMHRADGNRERAAAALFILALCEKESLEVHKAHVAGFCKAELLPLIFDPSADKLVRFRAVWIVETYATFLDKEDIGKLMLYYGRILTEPGNPES